MDASLRSKAEQLASETAGQAKTAEDLNGLMRLMMKSALEQMLDTEMDVHLGRKTLSAGGSADTAIPAGIGSGVDIVSDVLKVVSPGVQ